MKFEEMKILGDLRADRPRTRHASNPTLDGDFGI
jgi:hypothetical protein